MKNLEKADIELTPEPTAKPIRKQNTQKPQIQDEGLIAKEIEEKIKGSSDEVLTFDVIKKTNVEKEVFEILQQNPKYTIKIRACSH